MSEEARSRSEADEGKRRLREYLEASESRQEVYSRTALTFQSSQKRRDRTEARRELRAADDRLAWVTEAFFRDWREGWPVPDLCVVCDGEPWIKGNAAGMHLRPGMGTTEVLDENYRSHVVSKPCLHSGEAVVTWFPVPLVEVLVNH